MKPTREQCLEWARESDPELGNLFASWEDQIVSIIHRAYAEGQKDMRERAINIVETYRVSVGNSAAGEMAAEWTMGNLREVRQELRDLEIE